MGQSLVNALNYRQDYLADRHNVVSANIANSDTPNYVAQDLEFNSILQQTASLGLAKTSTGHMGSGRSFQTGHVTYDKTHIQHNGNSVKLDEQMLKLNDISINQNMVTKLYAKHAGMLRQVVQAGQ